MTHVEYEGKDLEAMSFAENYHAWVLDEFGPFLGKRVGEIGAGSGNFSSMIVEKGVTQLVAVEPSKKMHRVLYEKFRNDSKVICRNAIFSNISGQYEGYFDSIVYVNVLEHIEDDQGEIQYVKNALKKGGNICVFVPALQWLYSEFDVSIGHYRRYSKRQLRAMIENAGFEIVKIRYFDFLGIIPWFLFFKLFRKKLSSNDAFFYDRLAVPILRFIEAFLPIPLGKNLVIIGKKTN